MNTHLNKAKQILSDISDWKNFSYVELKKMYFVENSKDVQDSLEFNFNKELNLNYKNLSRIIYEPLIQDIKAYIKEINPTLNLDFEILYTKHNMINIRMIIGNFYNLLFVTKNEDATFSFSKGGGNQCDYYSVEGKTMNHIHSYLAEHNNPHSLLHKLTQKMWDESEHLQNTLNEFENIYSQINNVHNDIKRFLHENHFSHWYDNNVIQDNILLSKYGPIRIKKVMRVNVLAYDNKKYNISRLYELNTSPGFYRAVNLMKEIKPGATFKCIDEFSETQTWTVKEVGPLNVIVDFSDTTDPSIPKEINRKIRIADFFNEIYSSKSVTRT